MEQWGRMDTLIFKVGVTEKNIVNIIYGKKKKNLKTKLKGICQQLQIKKLQEN